MTAYPWANPNLDQRWDNCVPPYGTPNSSLLSYSLESNKGTKMQYLRSLRHSGALITKFYKERFML